MTDDEVAFLGSVEQARMIRAKEISPVELVTLYLERCDRLNPRLHAYLTLAADYALREADRATRGLGEPDLPPFHGVPISIKDLADTAGIRTTHGTASHRDHVPTVDDPVVAKLKRAGFIILGKSNTPEYGVGSTDPIGYDTCRNPWDLTRTVGGSSGGAAAAAAAGLCAVSHGGDGGGSIRIPAAYCGVVGVKPSRGRISNSPNIPSLLATAGPISRTVADAAGFLDAVSGYGTGDPWWLDRPARPFLEEAATEPGRLRIAVSTDCPEAPPFRGNADAITATSKVLLDLGHEVEEVTVPWPGADTDRAFFVSYGGKLAASQDEMPRRELLDPIIQHMLDIVVGLTAEEYVRAENHLRLVSRQVVAFFSDYDVLLCPSVAVPPLPIERLRDEQVDAEASLLVTSTFNITGQPAFSLPMHWHDDGMPVGVQIVGRPADEATLFRLAAQLENAKPWAARRPPCE
ncbi:MAG TPA: amidase [Acidimicrobiales bacterium]|nr:amidase [Acidimicrobiales bacterium]